MDATDTGIGAVLSQRHPKDQKFRPCAFFSWHLTQAERNYDVRDRELLTVVAVLQDQVVAGGGSTTFPHLDGPQESCLPPDCQEIGNLSGTFGSLP